VGPRLSFRLSVKGMQKNVHRKGIGKIRRKRALSVSGSLSCVAVATVNKNDEKFFPLFHPRPDFPKTLAITAMVPACFDNLRADQWQKENGFGRNPKLSTKFLCMFFRAFKTSILLILFVCLSQLMWRRISVQVLTGRCSFNWTHRSLCFLFHWISSFQCLDLRGRSL
jgi:hypothetical protein